MISKPSFELIPELCRIVDLPRSRKNICIHFVVGPQGSSKKNFATSSLVADVAGAVVSAQEGVDVSSQAAVHESMASLRVL
jgi:hypothetical protein